MDLYDIATGNQDLTALLAEIDTKAGADLSDLIAKLWTAAHQAGKRDVIADLEDFDGLTAEGREFLATNHA